MSDSGGVDRTGGIGCLGIVPVFLALSLLLNFVFAAFWSKPGAFWETYSAMLWFDLFVDFALPAASCLLWVIIAMRLRPSAFLDSKSADGSPIGVLLVYVTLLVLFFLLSAPMLSVIVWGLGVLYSDAPTRHGIVEMNLYFVSIPVQALADAIFFLSGRSAEPVIVVDQAVANDLYWIGRVWAWLSSFLAVSGTAKVAWSVFFAKRENT